MTMAEEHNLEYPDECLHPHCVKRRGERYNKQIEKWNTRYPELPPKPTFEEYLQLFNSSKR